MQNPFVDLGIAVSIRSGLTGGGGRGRRSQRHRAREAIESTAPAGATSSPKGRRDMPRIQGSPSRRTVAVGLGGLVLLIAAAVAAAVMSSTSSSSAARQVPFGGDRELSPALQKKLAVSQTFAPGETQYEGSQEAGDGASDWAMHSTPGNDISLSVINGSRLDWDALQARDNIFDEHGKLANLGPDTAVYPLNQFRNRYVYVPGQYVAAGRTVHSVIDPKCSDTACRLWIANAGGGVWRTDNALAAQPA